MTVPVLMTGFNVAAVAGSVLTAWKLAHEGLHRRYPVLVGYLIYLSLHRIYPLLMDFRSRSYFYVWLVTEPINWIFQILVVRELCGLVLERHPGLTTAGRWMMYGGTAISAAISLLSLLPRITSALPHRSRLLGYAMAADRGVNFSLAIFLLLMLALASRYPVPLNRNVVVSTVVFTASFLSNTLGALLMTVFDLRVGPVVDATLMGIHAACMLAWFLLLNRRGEEVKFAWPPFSPDQERRLLGHLDSLNRTFS
jgi:hypothetical protein